VPVLGMVWAFCAVAAGALSLLLVVARVGALRMGDLGWQYAVWSRRLPNPGDFSRWARPGSPMDCLLSSQESRLSVDLGYRSWPFVGDSAVDIVVGRTTTITGDGLEALEPYTRVEFLRAAGLSREVGLLHYLDFIGASQRPESEIPCAENAWRKPWHVATLSFWCDGVPRGSLYFDSSCSTLENKVPRHPVYLRARGIIDVARVVAATRLRKKDAR
jgi:hypothetical protein